MAALALLKTLHCHPFFTLNSLSAHVFILMYPTLTLKVYCRRSHRCPLSLNSVEAESMHACVSESCSVESTECGFSCCNDDLYFKLEAVGGRATGWLHLSGRHVEPAVDAMAPPDAVEHTVREPA